MKAKTFYPAVLAFVLIASFSFTDPILVKRITDRNFKYEFYTTLKAIEPHKAKIYYWFKGGAIHNAQGGAGGELLNGSYSKMFLDNQLAEQGTFQDGLKSGTWKTWHQNGKLESTTYWSGGFKDGSYYTYSVNGDLLEQGYFRKDKKHGRWVDFIKKDTAMYKAGTIVIPKPKLTKEEKQKAREDKAKAKKEASEAAKKEKQLREKNRQQKGKATTTVKPADKKPGFFERLFSRKPKK